MASGWRKLETRIASLLTSCRTRANFSNKVSQPSPSEEKTHELLPQNTAEGVYFLFVMVRSTLYIIYYIDDDSNN